MKWILLSVLVNKMILTPLHVVLLVWPNLKTWPMRVKWRHYSGIINSLRASSPFGDIVKSRRARGTREETQTRGSGGSSPLARVFLRGSFRSPKQESLLAGYINKTRKRKACEEALQLRDIVNRRRVCSQASQGNGTSPGVKPANGSPRWHPARTVVIFFAKWQLEKTAKYTSSMCVERFKHIVTTLN